MKKPLIFIALLFFAFFYSYSQNTARIEASSGKVIGMTSSGGSHGNGVIFEYNAGNGKDTIPINLLGTQPLFGNPQGSLIQASDGLLYGMAYDGGIYNVGVIFSFNPVTGKDTILVSFKSDWTLGIWPTGDLMQASNGLMYGMVPNGGANSDGILFCFDPVTKRDSVLVNFNGTNGSQPFGNLVQDKINGLLYGITEYGGQYGKGVLFSFNTITKKDSVLVNFDSINGAEVYGAHNNLVQASNGLFYVMTESGGKYNKGVLFSFNAVTNKDSVLINFDSTNGMSPYGSLIQAKDSLLYGTTMQGGKFNDGVLFSFNPVTGKDSVLLNFNGTNGANPWGESLVQDTISGILYGMTANGGKYGAGTVFGFDPSNGKDTVLVSFNGTNGQTPWGGLMRASNGLLYGMTQYGGTKNFGGVLFSYNTTTNKDSVLINFDEPTVFYPNGSLLELSNGIFYGTNEWDGYYGEGTLFSFDPTTGKDTVLVNFNGTNGEYPIGLMQASNGIIYGMTSAGGKRNMGTIFSFNTITNKDSTLVSLLDSVNGSVPWSGMLIQAKDSMLYGMTYGGGKYNKGVLFKYNPYNGKDSVLLSFDSANGQNPWSCQLVQDTNGLLYGMTTAGGQYNDGVLFSFNPVTGKDSVLVNFSSSIGWNPYGSLMRASNGLLYGFAFLGGANFYGALFSYNPVTNIYSIVHNFNGHDGAETTFNNLVQDSISGLIYGTTSYGGQYSYGVFFSLNPVTNAYNVLFNFNDTNGANPNCILFLKRNTLGVNEVNQKASDIILVYPNPFKDIATIVFGEEGKHYVELDNLNGQKLKYMECTAKNCEISRDNLATGMYIVKVYNSNKQFVSSSKIVVQ